MSAGQGASGDDASQLFESCVDRLNKMDENAQFVCTMEREDLCAELCSIGALCEMPDDDWVDEWRGW